MPAGFSECLERIRSKLCGRYRWVVRLGVMEAEGFVEGFVAQMIDTIDHCQTQLLYPRQYSYCMQLCTLVNLRQAREMSDF